MLIPYLHTASIVLCLGHPDIKASLLTSGSHCGGYCTGLLDSAVDGQLIKGNLKKGDEFRFDRQVFQTQPENNKVASALSENTKI